MLIISQKIRSLISYFKIRYFSKNLFHRNFIITRPVQGAEIEVPLKCSSRGGKFHFRTLYKWLLRIWTKIPVWFFLHKSRVFQSKSPAAGNYFLLKSNEKCMNFFKVQSSIFPYVLQSVKSIHQYFSFFGKGLWISLF